MEILLNVLFVLMRFLDFVTAPLFNYHAKGKKKLLPACENNELLNTSATELARRIRNKQISSEELCKVYIERIKAVNPIINAIVEDRFKAALKEAKQADDFLRTTSLGVDEIAKIKPLLGIPVTIKESCSVKGMSLTGGIQSRLHCKAESDGDAVAKIRNCGGIILLVSTTPELCLSWETTNLIRGNTNNPYDTTCTTAGSSGGEGALIGAGASIIGIGSDIAGSIRLPAAFNGIFGHKPTPRIISIKGHFPYVQDEKFSTYLVIGPLTRYAVDLKLMMSVMGNSKAVSELELKVPVNLSELNVFYLDVTNLPFKQPKVSVDIKSVLSKSINHLKKNCGATIKMYEIDDFINASEICGSEIARMRDIPNPYKWENSTWFSEVRKSIFSKSKFTLNLLHFHLLLKILYYLTCNHVTDNENWKNKLVAKLGTNGVLILPTFIGPAHKHHQILVKNGFMFMLPSNSLGLPATSIPCGLNEEGLPLAIQVMAAPYQDRLCLAIAEELERSFGGWIPPPTS